MFFWRGILNRQRIIVNYDLLFEQECGLSVIFPFYSYLFVKGKETLHKIIKKNKN